MMGLTQKTKTFINAFYYMQIKTKKYKHVDQSNSGEAKKVKLNGVFAVVVGFFLKCFSFALHCIGNGLGFFLWEYCTGNVRGEEEKLLKMMLEREVVASERVSFF